MRPDLVVSGSDASSPLGPLIGRRDGKGFFENAATVHIIQIVVTVLGFASHHGCYYALPAAHEALQPISNDIVGVIFAPQILPDNITHDVSHSKFSASPTNHRRR